jgi:hypothetical protein
MPRAVALALVDAVGRVIGCYTAESFVEFVDADVEITTGVLAAECEALRNRYFRK